MGGIVEGKKAVGRLLEVFPDKLEIFPEGNIGSSAGRNLKFRSFPKQKILLQLFSSTLVAFQNLPTGTNSLRNLETFLLFFLPQNGH
jgi:hypothetical protein